VHPASAVATANANAIRAIPGIMASIVRDDGTEIKRAMAGPSLRGDTMGLC
jgi:hypothetical protein